MSHRFANDLFISYSHKDNLDGWVEKFQERLQNRLAQLDVEVAVWRDKKLRGADVFSDEIFAQLKQSALLISIVSPTGLRSNWCRNERQKFEQFAQASSGFKVGNKVRAIKVVKTPEDGDVHRDLFGTLGYEFYIRDKQGGVFHEYHASDPEYEKLIDELAQEIKKILQVLRPPADEPTKPRVYVALTSSDLEVERAKIAQQLMDWGYSVYPSDTLRADAPGLRVAIESQMAECMFSTHLVSDKRGLIPDEEEKPLSVIQYEVAEERRIDRIVWVKPGSQPHAAFQTARMAGSQRGLDFLEGGTIESLKEMLALRVNGLKERAAAAGPSQGGGKLSLYVICDRKDHPDVEGSQDRENALKFKGFLQSKGFSVWHPPSSMTDKRELLKDHRKLLKDSHAVVLYWGAADEAWFRENLRDLEAARVQRRNRPFAAEAIYFSQPERSEKEQYRKFVNIVLDEFDGFHPDRLQPLLERLRAA